MPGMDGADFVRAFRALPGARDVPVVVVTVYEDRSYCYQALEAGATDFLLSPVDHVEFRARARNLLTLRKQQKLLEQRTHELRRELVSSSEQHEAALRASELRLRRLIDTVPAIISAVDAQRPPDPDQQRPQAALRHRPGDRDRPHAGAGLRRGARDQAAGAQRQGVRDRRDPAELRAGGRRPERRSGAHPADHQVAAARRRRPGRRRGDGLARHHRAEARPRRRCATRPATTR